MSVFWFVMGLTIGVLSMWGWQHKPQRKPTPSGDKPKTYGHPHAPVPYLKKELPDPPTGFFWELRIAAATDGTPFLHLGLVNAASGQSVGETKASLVSRNSWSSYASDYRNYSSIKTHIFKRDLIGPLLDWAERQVNKHTDPSLVGEYTVES